jgi:signal transduction histidine kinase
LVRLPHATAETVARPESEAPVLRGRWLVVGRAGWGALVVLGLGLFAAAVPALHAQRGTPPEDVLAGLTRLGIPADLYAAYVTFLLAVFGLGCFAVAGVIAWRRSIDPMAMFVSLFLVLLGGPNHPNVKALAAVYPAFDPVLKFSWGLLMVSLILFVFLFPDGRFVPRWMRLPIGLSIVGIFVALFAGGGSLAEPPAALVPILAATLLTGTVAQVHRYRRVSSPEGRQQTKWVVFGIMAAISVQVGSILLTSPFTGAGLPALLYSVSDVTVVTLAYLLIPLAIGVAILRYRLYDIDLVINRALVYGVLSACVVGIYVLVVGYLGGLLGTDGDLAISLFTTGVVAVLFAPLRDRLQRSVNRLMYGERDDPYAVLSRLGERLEGTLAPEAVLPTITQTVREALKLPYVAIALGEGESFAVAAESGSPVGGPLRLPLAYQGETVGELRLAPRTPGEEFTSADRRLLDDLTRQAGIAVYAVRLTTDLQRSRERLVTTREEERRRLRRDLHDGLGPTLGSLPLKLDVAGDLLERDPVAARELLRGLKEQSQSAVADIRRLVYELRPPALDELGLVGAIRETAAQHTRNGLRASVDAAEGLPPLPAAVEVAAYRIAQEALNNVARHAGANDCVVGLVLDEKSETLWLEIEDDGRGIEVGHGQGVGLHSMRERAAELGGTCVILSGPAGGTHVRASLPVPDASDIEPKVKT